MNAYLIFKYLRDLAESGRWNAFESNFDDGPFFLKHMDDKGDHILVDDEYNITGIIDWIYARVVISLASQTHQNVTAPAQRSASQAHPQDDILTGIPSIASLGPEAIFVLWGLALKKFIRNF